MEDYGFDWLRFTGPLEVLEAVNAWACGRWGHESQTQQGFSFFKSCTTWAGGAKVLTEHSSGNLVMVELSGDVLELLTPDQRLDICEELLELGLVATRVDIAYDVRGDDVRLVEAVEASCRRGELCGARSHRPRHEYGSRGEFTRLEYDIGKRGSDGSGRFVRVYDKGLETDTLPRGKWHRFEVEFSGDCAGQVVSSLVYARRISSDWLTEAANMCFGSIDFRSGEDHRRALVERPRVAWWSFLLGDIVPLRVKAKQVASTLAGVCTWLETAVLPGLQAMADRSRRPLSDVVKYLMHKARGDVFDRRVGRAALKTAAVQFGKLHRSAVA